MAQTQTMAVRSNYMWIHYFSDRIRHGRMCTCITPNSFVATQQSLNNTDHLGGYTIVYIVIYIYLLLFIYIFIVIYIVTCYEK